MDSSDKPNSPIATAAPAHAAPALATGRIKSEDLLKGRSELLIVHQGREYRLRVTQNGKLILTA